jgi:hypothetical protein
MPFISSVKLARIDDSYVIPTAIYYDGKKAYIGREARDLCPSPDLLIENFKIELGAFDPDGPKPRGAVNTPVDLAKDFFEETLKRIDGWLQVHGLTLPTRVLIAEPLPDLVTESWLANYRKSIRKALYRGPASSPIRLKW